MTLGELIAKLKIEGDVSQVKKLNQEIGRVKSSFNTIKMDLAGPIIQGFRQLLNNLKLSNGIMGQNHDFLKTIEDKNNASDTKTIDNRQNHGSVDPDWITPFMELRNKLNEKVHVFKDSVKQENNLNRRLQKNTNGLLAKNISGSTPSFSEDSSKIPLQKNLEAKSVSLMSQLCTLKVALNTMAHSPNIFNLTKQKQLTSISTNSKLSGEVGDITENISIFQMGSRFLNNIINRRKASITTHPKMINTIKYGANYVIGNDHSRSPSTIHNEYKKEFKLDINVNGVEDTVRQVENAVKDVIHREIANESVSHQRQIGQSQVTS